jgi:hypothetical protein
MYAANSVSIDSSSATAYAVDNGKSRPHTRKNGGTKGHRADILGKVVALSRHNQC